MLVVIGDAVRGIAERRQGTIGRSGHEECIQGCPSAPG